MDGRKLLGFGAAGFVGMMLAVVSAIPVYGQSPTQPVTVTAHRAAPLTERVPFGDLSLATRDGQRTLYRRVRYAVNRVCPQGANLWTYDVSGCRDFAWYGAKPQIDRAITAAAAGAPLAMAIEVTNALSD
jgi:UrcA family protein